MVIVGKFGKTHGSDGSILVHSFTQIPDNIRFFSDYYFKNGDLIEIKFIKKKNSGFLTKLNGIETPEKAKILTNKYIYIKRDCLPKVNNDEYYFSDLIGLEVYIENIKIGDITAVNNHGAGDYCEVRKKTGLFLFPFIKGHVKEVNIELNKIILCRNYYSNEI